MAKKDQAAPPRREPVKPVRRDPPIGEKMRRLIERSKVPAVTGNLSVGCCFAAVPNTLQPLRMISVIMILMYGHDFCRGIYYRNRCRAGAPNQPVVPPETPDYQRWDVTVHPTRENEIIDGMLAAPLTASEHMIPKTMLPIGGSKFPGFRDIDLPTPPDHEEALAPCGHVLNSTQKIAHQHDVAVNVGDNRMASQILGLCEDAAQIFSSGFIPLDLLHMPDSELARRFGCSRIISDQDHLDVLAEEQPTLDRIALNDRDLAFERLRCGKNSQHGRIEGLFMN